MKIKLVYNPITFRLHPIAFWGTIIGVALIIVIASILANKEIKKLKGTKKKHVNK